MLLVTLCVTRRGASLDEFPRRAWEPFLSRLIRVSRTSRIFLAELETCIEKEEYFAFETTLSGRIYLKLIKRLQALGWHIELIYLALPTIEMSKARVAERVKHDGHNIPINTIERRFSRSLRNLFNNFSHEVNNCVCFINTSDKPTLVFEQQKTPHHFK